MFDKSGYKDVPPPPERPRFGVGPEDPILVETKAGPLLGVRRIRRIVLLSYAHPGKQVNRPVLPEQVAPADLHEAARRELEPLDRLTGAAGLIGAAPESL